MWIYNYAENNGYMSKPRDRKTPSFKVDFKNNGLEIPLKISRVGRAYWHNALMGFFVDKFTSFHYVKNWATNIWKDKVIDVLTFEIVSLFSNLKMRWMCHKF